MSNEDRIQQAIAGSADKTILLGIIIDEYGTSIKRLIFTYVRDWEMSSDLTQEVFVTVYEKMETFKGQSSFKTWLFTIAVNKAKDYLKSWSYRRLIVNEKVLTFTKDTKFTPEEYVIQHNQSSELLKAIWSLKLKYREVFLLHYYQDLSIQEISTTLNLSVSTVKTRLYRGKEKLRKLINYIDRGENHG